MSNHTKEKELGHFTQEAVKGGAGEPNHKPFLPNRGKTNIANNVTKHSLLKKPKNNIHIK